MAENALKSSGRVTGPPLTSPVTLMRQMLWLAAVSIIVIVAASGYGIFRVNTHHIINEAEGDAISVSQLMLAIQKDAFIQTAPDGAQQLRLAPSRQQELAESFRSLLEPFDIVKIKVFDRNKQIIFSTDPSIIGRVDLNNRRLDNALAGNSDSKLETKENVQDLHDERRFNVDVVETYVPVRGTGGEVIGSFEVYIDVSRHRQSIWTSTLVSGLIILGILLLVFGLASLVLRRGAKLLQQVQNALRELATSDPLTGIYNRGELLARAEAEIGRMLRQPAEQPGQAMGVVLFDVDFFKEINDNLGHTAGDEVLCRLSERIASSLRGYDVFGRYGGDEFLLFFPGYDQHSVLQIADRLRTLVSATPFTIGNHPLTVTVTLGVTVITPNDPNLEQAIVRADQGLIRAKRAGRNQVCQIG